VRDVLGVSHHEPVLRDLGEIIYSLFRDIYNYFWHYLESIIWISHKADYKLLLFSWAGTDSIVYSYFTIFCILQ
jgi:hypothetical protein